MIERLTGTIIPLDAEYILLDVAGVGYKVYVTQSTLSKAKSGTFSVWTYLSVRENALDLYGFLEHEELDLFKLLLGISGIGPKSALGVLSVADLGTLNSAIGSGDISYLTKVSGIGKKSAERIVIELKDKVDVEGGAKPLQADLDALDALTAMGYSTVEAREALKEVNEGTSPPAGGAKERIKEALKLISKKI